MADLKAENDCPNCRLFMSGQVPILNELQINLDGLGQYAGRSVAETSNEMKLL